MNQTLSTTKAFKRGPSLETSKWYMGILNTNLAEKKDTDGAFCLIESILAPGNEPPPHVHSREDELVYVLDGEFDVYVGEESFKVSTGESVFLPKFLPHAFMIRSPRIRTLTLFAPAGLEDAFRSLSSPAKALDLPSGVTTYSTADLVATAQRLDAYGIHLLTPSEVVDQLPLYAKSPPTSNRVKFATTSTHPRTIE